MSKGVSNQVLSNSDHEVKSYSCSNSSTKMEKKQKNGTKFSGLQNEEIMDFKSGQKDYNSGQGFHIRGK